MRNLIRSERCPGEEQRQRAQIASWQREIERMSAQLIAERRMMESPAGERLNRRAGKLRLRKATRPGEKAHPRAGTTNGPERPGRTGGAG